jgi:hypothetical protein
MDQTRGGDGASWDDDPHGQPAREGGQQQPPASNFPTFGQTPGWQDEPDPYAARQPRDQPYGQQYGQQYGQPWEQQPDDQGYGYPGYAYDQPPVPAPGYGYPGYGPRYAAETETGSIVALILAILSWIACPVILAVPAIVVASNSRAKIRSFPERYSGLSLVTAARVIAWANIGLFVGVITLMAIAAMVSSVRGF